MEIEVCAVSTTPKMKASGLGGSFIEKEQKKANTYLFKDIANKRLRL